MILLLFIGITILYCFLIGSLAYGFEKVKHFTFEKKAPNIGFSVIIPFRNEAEHLPELLTTLERLQYPKHLFEVLLVNDASEDNSVAIINQHLEKNSSLKTAGTNNIKILDNIRRTASPKKDAITTAIEITNHDWIVTSDADCQFPQFWLHTFAACIEKNEANFIVAPVTYKPIHSFLERFQLLDFLSLQGATIGGFGLQKPFLCSGANLAYRKTFFKKVHGFDGNTNIASGDDIFLLEKALKEDAKKVHYLKTEQAIVTTKAVKTYKDLISQRVRWASKSANYNNTFAKVVGLLVLLMNASLICALALSITGVFNFKTVLALFVIKSSFDFVLLYKTLRFYSQKEFLTSFIFSSFLYPFFSVYVVIVATFSNYKWKGRAFNK